MTQTKQNQTKQNNSNSVASVENRYIVGIDLGTTNSAMMSIDVDSDADAIESFPLFQKTAPGESDNRRTLPSFRFLDPNGEIEVGTYARDYGASQPGRLIWSAKSWLCHSQVDRTASFLPWKAPQDVKQMSPVDAQSRYLKFVADRWNDVHPEYPLAKQDIVITLPASFDETARELTIRAAAKAGLQKVVLIEEPQAAFYAWIYKRIASQKTWNDAVKPGDKILVIDVGGGTSDFSLIHVQPESEDGQEVSFHRIAVGDHLLLGGDNLDLALAKYLESKFAQDGIQITDRQWQTLVRQSRIVKETLLGDNPPETCTASVPTSGSKLIAKSLHQTVTRDEIQKLLLDGFFPLVDLNAQPTKRHSGFQEFGLPFASDPAITRYLAAFLTAHGERSEKREARSENVLPHELANDIQPINSDERFANLASRLSPLASCPDAVLFNGGMFESPLTRQRILEQLSQWFSTEDGSKWYPKVLDNDDLDLAVARGAAYFGLVRRGDTLPSKAHSSQLVRIHATLARSYYIGLQQGDKLRAMCIAPANIQEGETLRIERIRETRSEKQEARDVLPHDSANDLQPINSEECSANLASRLSPLASSLTLQVGVPVEFPLFVSSSRTTDEPGTIIDVDENQMHALAPLRTVIKKRSEKREARSERDVTRDQGLGTREEKGTRDQGLGTRDTLNNPQSPIPSPQSPIPNPQSPVPSPQSPKNLPVVLQTHLTEIGTLELSIVSQGGAGQWRLNFDVRSAIETDKQSVQTTAESEGVVDENIVEQSKAVLKSCFESFEFKPSEVVKRITAIVGQGRESWPAPMLRSLFDELLQLESGRKKSAAHESRWLYLAGFFLRPGIGASMDDWRIEQLWKLVYGKLLHPLPDNRLQLWILWRRVAAGLSSGRQTQLAEPILRQLRTLVNRLKTGRGRNDWTFATNESSELFRLFGALEKLPVDRKEELGVCLLELLGRKEYSASTSALLWALGRLGARESSVATLETIVPPEIVETWLKTLLRHFDDNRDAAFAIVLMSRKTGDRYRDISDSFRDDLVRRLQGRSDVNPHWITLIRDGGTLETQEQTEAFGETLPTGLWLS